MSIPGFLSLLEGGALGLCPDLYLLHTTIILNQDKSGSTEQLLALPQSPFSLDSHLARQQTRTGVERCSYIRVLWAEGLLAYDLRPPMTCLRLSILALQ